MHCAGFHGQLGCNHDGNEDTPRLVQLGHTTLPDNPTREEEIMAAVVSCGGSHSVSISRRGDLYSWGLHSSGELGLGRHAPTEVFLPRQVILTHRRIVSVTAGESHTLAISENGELWACGRGRRGQLGRAAFHDFWQLQRIDSLRNFRIVSAAAGQSHSMALASDGSLFTWGDGQYGQLGHAALEQIQMIQPLGALAVPIPQKIGELEPSGLSPPKRITAIAAGGNHSMALTVCGELLAFGRNHRGQLGLGEVGNRWRPSRVDLSIGAAVRDSVRAVQVSCGACHTLALILQGTRLKVLSTGDNYWGQLGHGDVDNRLRFVPITAILHAKPVAVQCGAQHSCAVTERGVLYTWGRGDCGQLGGGDEWSRRAPAPLEGFRVVHPDRTLRRTKRCAPKYRAVRRQEAKAPWCLPRCFEAWWGVRGGEVGQPVGM
ncbi:unnamed protein product [Ostreobium quekettii]|uniref:RCC1-like domain-containing protein n=1 Tax=Ostreobium quekettii TaxID=121088 RepID=A0A8S1IQ76_9CHLO|nr:unnamed protein product [Ostreobium quekettii]